MTANSQLSPKNVDQLQCDTSVIASLASENEGTPTEQASGKVYKFPAKFLEAAIETETDEQLVERARTNPEAFEILFKRFRYFINCKARNYFLAGGETDDLVQEGSIGFLKAVRDYEPDHNNSFRTFVELCVKRQLITAIKTASRQKHLPLNTYISWSHTPANSEFDTRTLADVVGDTAPKPEDIVIGDEKLRAMLDVICSDLSYREYTSFVMLLDGYNYETIAFVLDSDLKTVDNALQRVRSKLEEFK
jgi:RNA polymerase sporulation-specific sigma factor